MEYDMHNSSKQWISEIYCSGLKKKLTAKLEKQVSPVTETSISQQNNSKWVTFTCYSPQVWKVTNLFKNTNLKVAYWTSNTIHQQLTDKPRNKNPSRIHQLKRNTCKNEYILQSRRSITVRHREHIRYIGNNNPTSVYVMHILNIRHEFGTAEKT
jgi:transcriptional regulator with AAA-type ATPase domain